MNNLSQFVHPLLFSSLVLTMVLASCQTKEKSIKFGFDWPEGMVVDYQIQDSQTVKMNGLEQKKTSLVSLTFEKEDTPYHVTMNLASIHVESTTPQGATIYDSESGMMPSRSLNPELFNTFQAVNRPISIQLDTLGNIASIFSNDGSDGVHRTDSILLNFVNTVFQFLPDHPVHEESHWEVEQSFSLGTFNTQMKNRYKLSKISGDTAFLKVKGTLTLKNKELQINGMTVKISLEWKQEGEALASISQSRILSANLESEIKTKYHLATGNLESEMKGKTILQSNPQ